MSTAPVVVTDRLSRSFGETSALADVTVEVAPGEIFGFIGPDGAGKTTLFRILATLLLPDRGTAKVLGRDVVDEVWAVRSRIGYMPGRFALYPDLSVAENLEFFASVFGTTVAANHGLIAPIYQQIEPFRDRRARDLSGGMKQKLALSCALVHRPEVLFLDEPTTGVDAVSRREFWDLLDELRRDGLPIVVSTPYMDEASRCDRVALIQDGRVLTVDAPANIGADYRLPLVAVSGPDRYRLLLTLRRYPHAHAVHPFGAELHYTDARADIGSTPLLAELREYLAREGFPEIEVRSITAGIEDTFMARMGASSEQR